MTGGNIFGIPGWTSGHTTKTGDSGNLDIDMLSELKKMSDSLPMAYGLVVYPGGGGLIVHKIEPSVLRTLLAKASAENAFIPPVLVVPQAKEEAGSAEGA